MTTPPTPAGWYPDPDGSGGQRYWDGSAWAPAEHGAHAAPEPEFSERPTDVVSTALPAEERVGSHRAPEPEPEPEPASEAGPEPEPASEAGPEPGPTAPVDQPTTRMALPTAPPPQPPSFTPPPVPANEPSTPDDDRRKLIVWFGAACAALLAVMVLVFIYALFIHEDNAVQIGATDTTTTTSESPTTTSAEADEPTETETESPTATPGGETVDGPLSFSLIGVETGTTVTSTDATVEKTAQGEFIVVRLSVVNTSDAPATFLGTFQKLNAGGTTYSIDDEASFYVGGGFVEIPPGGQATVGVAYDVPPGTVAESIELHADPMSAGVVLPL